MGKHLCLDILLIVDINVRTWRSILQIKHSCCTIKLSCQHPHVIQITTFMATTLVSCICKTYMSGCEVCVCMLSLGIGQGKGGWS